MQVTQSRREGGFGIADRVWRTRSQLELAIVEWASWYDQHRLHSGLGDLPPVEYEQLHAAARSLAAGVKSGSAPPISENPRAAFYA